MYIEYILEKENVNNCKDLIEILQNLKIFK